MAVWLLPPIGAIIGSTIYSEYPMELPTISVTYLEVSGQSLSTSGNNTLIMYDPIIITKATYGWNDSLNSYDITKKLQHMITGKSGTMEFEIQKTFGIPPYYSKTKAGIGAIIGLGIGLIISRLEYVTPSISSKDHRDVRLH